MGGACRTYLGMGGRRKKRRGACRTCLDVHIASIRGNACRMCWEGGDGRKEGKAQLELSLWLTLKKDKCTVEIRCLRDLQLELSSLRTPRKDMYQCCGDQAGTSNYGWIFWQTLCWLLAGVYLLSIQRICFEVVVSCFCHGVANARQSRRLAR